MITQPCRWKCSIPVDVNKMTTKHWKKELEWENAPKEFGRWHNINSMRTVQFAQYRGPDDMDRSLNEKHAWHNKYYLSIWGGGRPDKELLFTKKSDALAKLKKMLANSDMKYKLGK